MILDQLKVGLHDLGDLIGLDTSDIVLMITQPVVYLGHGRDIRQTIGILLLTSRPPDPPAQAQCMP